MRDLSNIVFFDTETICLESQHGIDTLLSLSMIKDKPNGLTERKNYKFVMTGFKANKANPRALEINGYNENDWKDAVYFEDVAHEIADFIHGCPLVAHNIDFDLRHLREAFTSVGWSELSTWSRNKTEELSDKKYSLGRPFIDTQSLSFLFTDLERVSLNSLREHLDISTNRAHSADTDTEDCRAVFYYIVDKFLGNQSINE
jgi:DNA polymerase III alpha subunit (gram-positive type)